MTSLWGWSAQKIEREGRIELGRGVTIGWRVMHGAAVVLLSLGACEFPEPVPPSAPQGEAAAAPFPVVIVQPRTLGVVDTGAIDAQGFATGVGCDTCHARAGQELAFVDRAELPPDFHAVALDHGDFACDACHAADDRTRLRLISGERIAFADVMRLCAQCHGPQFRDYRHGAHGGMRGYWDLSRGPRERNSCVACHAPHSPAYPAVQPAPPPRDRFFGAERAADAGEEGDHE